jgi:hypothetical protein
MTAQQSITREQILPTIGSGQLLAQYPSVYYNISPSQSTEAMSGAWKDIVNFLSAVSPDAAVIGFKDVVAQSAPTFTRQKPGFLFKPFIIYNPFDYQKGTLFVANGFKEIVIGSTTVRSVLAISGNFDRLLKGDVKTGVSVEVGGGFTTKIPLDGTVFVNFRDDVQNPASSLTTARNLQSNAA